MVQFKGTPVDAPARIPAQAVESVVEAEICKRLADSAGLLRVLTPLALPATEQQTLVHQATRLSETWEGMAVHQKIEHLSAIVKKITLSRSMLTIAFSLPGLVRVLVQHDNYQGEKTHEVCIAVTLKRCGVETKLLVEQTTAQNNLKPHADSLRAVQEALKKALTWNAALVSGTAKSTKLLAEESGVSQRYVAQLIKLAYLSPAIIQKILKGDVPHDLTLGKLKTGIPLDWKKQESLFSS